MLKVIVHNAESVPNLERFTNVDPMVTLIFQGITKETNWQRSTCDPKWEETLEYPLNDVPISNNDVLEIYLKDHETIGANKLIGQGVLPLVDVIRTGLIKRRFIHLTNPQGISLEATKLYLTLEYTPPTKNPVDSMQNKSGDPESIFPRETKARSSKAQDFQIRVKILRGRQLEGSNIDPVGRVRLFGMAKQTQIRKGTNHPFFNEVFFFNRHLSELELTDEMIEFEVCNSRTLRSDMKIGQFKIDMGHIYSQNKHSINRQWLLLSHEDDRMTGAKGYLKVSVNILGPGDEAPSNETLSDADDDIESNLLKPAGLMLRPATFLLKLYKAEDFPRMDSSFLHGVKKIFHSSEEVKDLVDPYVKFSFAGHQVQSKIVYTCSHPEFNQELRLPLKFPSMCDKITLIVMDWDRLQFDDIIGTTLLNIRSICDDRENGFLPTFGPSWLNIYGSPREYSELPTALDELNTGKGEGVAYRGRLFIELETILGESPNESIGEIANSDLIQTLPYQSRKKYKLHAAFLDASMLAEHESTIEFEVSIGNYGNKFEDLIGNANCSTTPPTNAVFDGTAYYFLPWGHTKPCVQVTSEWEDITFRLESINQLAKVKLFINGLLSTLSVVRMKKISDDVLIRHYKQSLDRIVSHLKKPLPEPELGRHHVNELDRMRRKMREKDLREMVQQLERVKSSARHSEEIISTLEMVRDQLEYLQSEPQNSIPDVIIWLLANGKRYAYYRLPAHEVFFSNDIDRQGHLCGRVQTITLKWPGKSLDVARDKRDFLPAEIRVKIWFGLAVHEQDWLSQQKGADLVIYAETYENQTNVLGQWITTGPLMTRPAWSDVTGHMCLPKVNFQIPPGWRWEDDWYISPEISARYADDAGHRKFTEEVFEHQHRLIAGAQWQPKTAGWTDFTGDKVLSKDERVHPPAGWQWEDDWTIDTNRAVDEQGFEYCVNQTLTSWCPTEKLFHLNRRRRWFRPRILQENPSSSDRKRRDLANEVKTSGWEYAPMFNMRYHSDERSMDLTRRRRWHRKMIPDRANANENLLRQTTEETLIDTDVVFRMQTTQTSPSDPATQNNKDIKIELSAPRMFLSFKKAYYYELRAYIYQARHLLAMDYDNFSDPYAQIGFINQSQRTEVIQKTLCPNWDETLIFSDVELFGEPDDIYHDPPNILIELFDQDQYGGPDFLGRVQCSPLVRLVPDENKPAVRLKWFPIKRGKDSAGELLAAFELFLLPDPHSEKKLPAYPSTRGTLFSVPQSIRPELVRTGIEILCWGVRNMKSFLLSDVDCPQVMFEVGGEQIESTIIPSAKKTPNFDRPLMFLDVMLPKDDLYIPPMNIKVKDHRSFGRKPIVGYHIIKSFELYRCDPSQPTLTIAQSFTERESTDVVVNPISSEDSVSTSAVPSVTSEPSPPPKALVRKTMRKRVKHFLNKFRPPSQKSIKTPSKLTQIQNAILKHQFKYHQLPMDEMSLIEDDVDWWSKYHASKGDWKKSGNYLSKGYETFTVYPHPLESFELYEGFTDFCRTFELIRGKTKLEEENEIVGEFKGLFKVYSLPANVDEALPRRVMEHFPPNHLEECLVRVYVIRGMDLQAKDANGKSDPYIEIELGKVRMDNRDEKIPNSTDPVFGKMFEIKTILPLAKDLIVRIKDWDFLTSDDLIGQTTIDLENRFLSKYRATCGLPLQYNLTGPNQWRDCVRPRKILYDVCKRNNLSHPQLLEDGSIQLEDSIFHLEDFEQEKHLTSHAGEDEERLALYILHKLRLCPEHIETRPLFNALQPMIEQGRLELFVDIFPKSQGIPGSCFNVTPRKPRPYVLRCIIWNTSDVILQETSITGEQMSDIYVKGWMTGLENDVQKTDVHYRSMDGEGNFNWRFVYQFDYFPAEQSLSVKKKEHFWSMEVTEVLLPPVLNLQIWDNDKFTPDDFLGALTLDLNRLYKPAKDAETCSVEIFNEKASNHVSIFEMKQLKGWWPCVDLHDGQTRLTGKVEVELEILSEEESRERPAGRGREKPNDNPKLEVPQRPVTSFLWFSSPFRTFKNIIWKKSKWYFLGLLLLVCLVIFILLFLWSLPNAVLSRLFHLST